MKTNSVDQWHEALLQEIKDAALTQTKKQHGAKYHGTPHSWYGLDTQTRRRIAKNWKKEHKEIPNGELLVLLSSLNHGTSYEEKTISAELLKLFSTARQEHDLSLLDDWLAHLEGWAEVDTLCQSTFSAEEMLQRWDEWQALLRKWSHSNSLSHQRASLVLLTKPVRDTKDKRLQTIAFQIIDQLKSDDHPLITKAISWLLREMIQNYRGSVSKYMQKNQGTLPKLVVREVYAKLNGLR